MNRYYYDFHIHSCLSPCGDDDMTPGNIAGMATLCGLNIVALTDHNSCKNCPAFFKTAKAYGIIPIAGMELTTAEDIHVVCLFEQLDDALAFDKEIEERLIKVENRVNIFGKQQVMNEDDEQIDEFPYLLINATDIPVDDVPAVVEKYNGVCFPAHIDRESNGIIATLGVFPDEPDFGVAEVRDAESLDGLRERFPKLGDMLIVCGSDAHYLDQMRDKQAYFELDDEPYSSSLVRQRLFEQLRRS